MYRTIAIPVILKSGRSLIAKVTADYSKSPIDANSPFHVWNAYDMEIECAEELDDCEEDELGELIDEKVAIDKFLSLNYRVSHNLD
jgi:hypothetical protein